MRETQFIKQNKEKWAKFDSKIDGSHSDPDELSQLFVELTDDLSYSRTFYPNRSVRVYLNNAAQRVFHTVYKNRKNRLFKFFDFWRETLPQIVYESRNSFYVSLLVFFGAVFIGAFSAHMDPDFPRVVLGDEYVEMTYENIDNGTPMAIYQDPNKVQMFLNIAQNNLMVASLTFVVGLFFGLGSLFVLVRNGIMLGAFQYLFFQEGVYWDSILTIWIHGTIEVACIIIAGAAGLTLGSGMVFPGTLGRLQSLQLSARRGLLLMISIMPLVVLAAFIEGFITRYASAPYWIRALTIIVSLVFVLGYYWIIPMLKARRGFTSFLGEVKLPAAEELVMDFDRVKTVGVIFNDAFILYRKYFGVLSITAVLFSIGLTFIHVYSLTVFDFETVKDITDFTINPGILLSYSLSNLGQVVLAEIGTLAWFVNVLGLAALGGFAQYAVAWQYNRQQEENTKQVRSYWINGIVGSLMLSGFINFIAVLDDGWFFLTTIFVVPALLLVLQKVFSENMNPVRALVGTRSLVTTGWVNLMGSYLMTLGIGLIVVFMVTAPLIYFFFELIVSALPLVSITTFKTGFYVFLYTYSFLLILPLLFMVVGVGFYSFREQTEALSLLDQIRSIGVRKRRYGMEQEN